MGLVFFAVVDVRTMRSHLLGAGPEEESLIEAALAAPSVAPHLYDTGGRVSRKKDFMPPIIRHLRQQALARGEPPDDSRR